MSLLSNIWLNNFLRQEDQRRACNMSPETFQASIAHRGPGVSGEYARMYGIYGDDPIRLTRPCLNLPSLPEITGESKLKPYDPLDPLSRFR